MITSELFSKYFCYDVVMKIVAKLLIEHNNTYLMLYRSDHPTFGTDPDLPGGTVEEDESSLVTVLREVNEEIGLPLHVDELRELYAGANYSNNGTFYSLFHVKLEDRPKITMSWEHSSFEWVEPAVFINKALVANDTYMHMVGETLKSLRSS